MDKIVYLLGAGFPAPLGLPLMNNFLEKSKDLYSINREKYPNFEPIYKLIRNLAYLKNFINSDLFNIEEILSILEMGFFVKDNKKELEEYKKFLKDVIIGYTPKINITNQNFNVGNWERFVFGKDRIIMLYGFFIINLFQIKIIKDRGVALVNGRCPSKIEFIENKSIKYDIITLNYDRVIENYVDFINKEYTDVNGVHIEFDNDLKNQNVNVLKYAKLHGCVSTDIILPTWNKKESQNIIRTWTLAHKLIREANEIRIIGYSLPVSDNYIRYLFASALKDSEHLKKIDVITLDADGITESRFRQLFIFNNFKFKSVNFLDYLSNFYPLVKGRDIHTKLETMEFNSYFIETAHRKFMNS